MQRKQISKQLAIKIASAAQNGVPLRLISSIFSTSRTTVYRITRNMQLYSKPWMETDKKKGRPRKISSDAIDTIKHTLATKSSTYHNELKNIICEQHDITVHKSTICRTLKYENISRKKLTRKAVEGNEHNRYLWQKYVYDHEIVASMIVSVDEMGYDRLDAQRKYGYATIGNPAVVEEAFTRGPKLTLIAALVIDQVMSYKVIPGAANADDFLIFLVDYVFPGMNPFPGDRSVLLIDNCKTHHDIRVDQWCRERGFLVLYLPAYTPIYQPVERLFKSIKTSAQRYDELMTDDSAADMLGLFTETISSNECESFFIDAGF
jgi:transposase